MFGCYGGREKHAAAGGREYKHGLMGNGKLGEKWKRDVLAGGIRLAPRVHAKGRIGVNRNVCNTHLKVVCSLKGGGIGIYTLKLKNKNTSLCFFRSQKGRNRAERAGSGTVAGAKTPS